ncbi:hypothetical protein ACNKHR_14985 [Shigella flexneri]
MKSAILRSMNDALITRVTGEENGQMRLEEIERQGLFFSGWMIPASGSAITRCLVTSCASAASGELAAELPEIHRAAAEAGWPRDLPAKRFIMRWRQAMC